MTPTIKQVTANQLTTSKLKPSTRLPAVTKPTVGQKKFSFLIKMNIKFMLQEIPYICARDIGGVSEPFGARYGLSDPSYTKIDRAKLPGYLRNQDLIGFEQKIEVRYHSAS